MKSMTVANYVKLYMKGRNRGDYSRMNVSLEGKVVFSFVDWTADFSSDVLLGEDEKELVIVPFEHISYISFTKNNAGS